ncbi:MAG TPA: DUF3747 domain-containing protein [Leptolyngbyaceae cyanobacterium M65_K2018_010]|nr:DUF3747 domain-containing protein [Leptolyngbyaceae cyanobacterium M65_K2018_010]
MNLFANFKVAALTAATLGLVGGVTPTLATSQVPLQPREAEANTLLAQQTFGNTPVNEANFLIVAAPGTTAQPYRLLIMEQIQPSPACWSIVNPGNARPTQVNALWNTFDFTGVCRMQRDTNGYSVRLAGQDVSAARFEINNVNGDLLLQFAQGVSRDRVTIGRTGGISPTGFTQIHLDPGWTLTKRTFNGQIVQSHLIYFTNDLTLAQLQGGQTGGGGGGTTTPPVTPPTLAFNDIRGNRYATQINRAAELGIMSGFPDGTFKPTSTLTREQAVSVVMETATKILPTSLLATLPTQVFSPPFPDVATNRWSALKIQQAKQLGLVSGDFGTGNFRPTGNVTRAELMAMMYKLALLRVDASAADPSGTPAPGSTTPTFGTATGNLPDNVPNPPVFVDISGHWAQRPIQELASFCGIATPLNETGQNFAPDTAALRDFTAAAAVRAVDCPFGRPQ